MSDPTSEPLDPILEAARLQYDTLTVLGREFIIRQPSALQLIERRQRQHEDVELPELDEQTGKPKTKRQLREDATERGLAYLISVCVLNEDGKPAYNEKHAMVIATGAPAIAFPFINAVTGLISTEKKASKPTSDSGTA